MTQVTALILAGGQSSRMGQDKALLQVAGQPLLQRICDVALSCTPLVKVVTPWPNRYQNVLPPNVSFVLEEFLPQEVPQSHGPLVGLTQGLSQIDTPWALALACDLPNLEAKVLRTWVQHLDSLPTTTSAYLPKTGTRWEPLCGFYRRSCLPKLQDFIRVGGRSFQRWLDSQSVEIAVGAPQEMLLNLNTPEDVMALGKAVI
ncbi:MAG TPA: molybdenum cofactor guanylyltransferase [Leptolyngbyaceae cyanobacterium]